MAPAIDRIEVVESRGFVGLRKAAIKEGMFPRLEFGQRQPYPPCRLFGGDVTGVDA